MPLKQKNNKTKWSKTDQRHWKSRRRSTRRSKQKKKQEKNLFKNLEANMNAVASSNCRSSSSPDRAEQNRLRALEKLKIRLPKKYQQILLTKKKSADKTPQQDTPTRHPNSE